ncbi:MAG TPA: TPM domain-containing protein [Polyangiaceae bacterium]|jgi:putative membrane protein|nr:TPM domain-containing protein [Polyangiaceae bacterium]
MVTLLSSSEREQIESAIRQIEQRSALEVVVAVLRRSADYWHFRVGLSVSWGLAAGCAALLWLPHWHPFWALLLQLPVALLSYLVSGWKPLERLLTPGVYAARAVQARAFQLFAERGLHQTRAHTGLLVLVSELERRVVILGDSGVHVQVGEEGWQRHVDTLVERIREGRLVPGILEVLARIEAVAGKAQPVQPGDSNELPDAVIEA